jgi:heat shock protein HslJ
MMRISLILLSILTACFKDETVSGQTGDASIWVLETMNGIKVSSNITITFPEEGQIAGQATCNRYFGKQTVPMPWFEIKELGSTKMVCPELNLEAQYFRLLQEMTTAEIAQNMLILRADAGNSMIFVNK